MIRKQEITTTELPEGAVIWDVRESNSYAQGHLDGAVNFPLDTLEPEHLQQIPVEQPIYILCGGGSKAPRAAEKLEGFDPSRDYVILMGGTRAAEAAGIPIVKD